VTETAHVFEPRIVGFFCNWCSYQAADLAGTARIKRAHNLSIVRVMCSGRVDSQLVMWAFANGADGVLISGCHPGDCHYFEGNHKTLRRYTLLRRMLEQMGVQPERLRLEWIASSEADKIAAVSYEFVETIRNLGPLHPAEEENRKRAHGQTESSR